MTDLSSPVLAKARIADFDDPDFDPYATFDQASGIGEVDDPFPQIHEIHRRGTVQKGDLRKEFGLAPFAMWSDLDSYMVLGHSAVTKAYLNASTFSSEIMQKLYADSFGLSINGMDAPDHTGYWVLFQ